MHLSFSHLLLRVGGKNSRGDFRKKIFFIFFEIFIFFESAVSKRSIPGSDDKKYASGSSE